MVLCEDAVPTVFSEHCKNLSRLSANQANVDSAKTAVLYHQSTIKPLTVTVPPSSCRLILPKLSSTPPCVTLPDNASPATGITTVSDSSFCSSVDRINRDVMGVKAMNEQQATESDVEQILTDDRVTEELRPVIQSIRFRKEELSRARRKLRKCRAALKIRKERLKNLDSLLFTERVVLHNGKKVMEISLSDYAKEVFSDDAPNVITSTFRK